MATAEPNRQEELRRRVEAFRGAYQQHDVYRMVAMFAAEATYIAAPGTFHGPSAIRRFLQWDAELSPMARINDTGVGILVHGSTAIWEREFHLSAKGVPYREQSLAIIESNNDGQILRMRSYYDKLDVLDQITAGLPGPYGWLTHKIVAYLVELV